jgi:Replication initiator protein A
LTIFNSSDINVILLSSASDSPRGRLCCVGLPIRRPPRSSLVYERRNGLFTLQITGHPDFGLPFGQDRLVPIFLATLAVRQQSQIIRFKSAAQMLDTFGMAKGGKEYRRLVAAFERIFGATIFFGTDSTRLRARMIRRSRFNFLREAQIWYNRGGTLG